MARRPRCPHASEPAPATALPVASKLARPLDCRSLQDTPYWRRRHACLGDLPLQRVDMIKSTNLGFDYNPHRNCNSHGQYGASS